MLEGALAEKMTFEQKPEGGEGASRGRGEFQTQAASAKALRWAAAWCDGGTTRRPLCWSEGVSGRR